MNQTEIGFFCSPIGLGHASRDIAISEFLQGRNIHFVSGIGAAKLIRQYGYSVNDDYHPPNFDVQNGILKGSLGWLWKYYRYYNDCKKISQKFIDNEKPRVIVSEIGRAHV